MKQVPCRADGTWLTLRKVLMRINVNNSQSIERLRQYLCDRGCELSADQCKAAQLADGLISPKPYQDNREINPEIAG